MWSDLMQSEFGLECKLNFWPPTSNILPPKRDPGGSVWDSRSFPTPWFKMLSGSANCEDIIPSQKQMKCRRAADPDKPPQLPGITQGSCSLMLWQFKVFSVCAAAPRSGWAFQSSPVFLISAPATWLKRGQSSCTFFLDLTAEVDQKSCGSELFAFERISTSTSLGMP